MSKYVGAASTRCLDIRDSVTRIPNRYDKVIAPRCIRTAILIGRSPSIWMQITTFGKVCVNFAYYEHILNVHMLVEATRGREQINR